MLFAELEIVAGLSLSVSNISDAWKLIVEGYQNPECSLAPVSIITYLNIPKHYCAKRTLRLTAQECPGDILCPPSSLPDYNHFLRAASWGRDSVAAAR